MTREPRVGIRIGDTPIDELAFGIVGAGQTPRTGRALFHRHVGPGGAARLARRGGGVEFPNIFAGLGVVRGDETVLTLGHFAGPAGNHFAIGDEHAARRLPAVVHLGLPTDRSGLGIEGDQDSVWCGKIDHVLIDADGLGTRRLRMDALGVMTILRCLEVSKGNLPNYKSSLCGRTRPLGAKITLTRKLSRPYAFEKVESRNVTNLI